MDGDVIAAVIDGEAVCLAIFGGPTGTRLRAQTSQHKLTNSSVLRGHHTTRTEAAGTPIAATHVLKSKPIEANRIRPKRHRRSRTFVPARKRSKMFSAHLCTWGAMRGTSFLRGEAVPAAPT